MSKAWQPLTRDGADNRDQQSPCCGHSSCHCREAELQERELQYRSIFEATSDGLEISDIDGCIVQANAALCTMYGYTYAEMIGLDFRRLVDPDQLHDVPGYRAAVSRGETFVRQGNDRRKDGAVISVEVRGAPFTYRGQPHMLAVVRDVTERVKTEQAVREERQRLSRELHDSVSQALYSIALGTRTARALLDSNPAQIADPLDFVLGQTERAMAEMRALLFDLRPEALETEGLIAAVQKHVAAAEARNGIVVQTALDDEPAVSLLAKEALYRIVQEALHNTVKHGEARRVAVRLRQEESELVLEVQDDGKGFDTNASFPGHLGLHSMRERVERVGGVLEMESMLMESMLGTGTTIRARMPCQAGKRGGRRGHSRTDRSR